MNVKTITPVIYSGGAGGGPSEYASSSDPNVPNNHEITIGGGPVRAVFWAPLHNIPDITKFAFVDVVPSPTNPDGILLSVGSWGGGGRVRLKITVIMA